MAQSAMMLNQQGLFDQTNNQDEVPNRQMGFLFPYQPNNLTFSSSSLQSLKNLTHPLSSETLIPSLNTPQNPTELAHITTTSDFEKSHLLSLQRSKANLWAWGDEVSKRSSSSDFRDHHDVGLGVSTMKMKKIKAIRRKVTQPRFCFKTLSEVDVLDDGYKWRKYGQKVVKNTQHPRSYYRCSMENCRVKKRVERLADDPRMVITTYEGRHAHSPSNDLEDSESPSRLNNFFW